MKREPLFNIPPVVVALVGAFVLIHVAREYVLGGQTRDLFDATFAFNPLRYEASPLADGGFPGGFGAEIWTFVTYAFIHGSFTHLGLNTIWFLPFGSAVARRLGASRFLLFFAATAAAGALAHLVTHVGENEWVVGASASISGMMAAAMRFAFQRGGPLNMMQRGTADTYDVPAISLVAILRDKRILIFVGIWFAINILFGVGSLPITGSDQPVAWQAHIGGFLAGLILFSWFDRPGNNTPPDAVPPTQPYDDIGATRH